MKLKKLLAIIVFAFILVSMIPTYSTVYAAFGDVKFNIEGTESTHTYNSSSDPIGSVTDRGGHNDPGSQNSKRYFIGWSTSSNYTGAEGQLFAYGNESISKLFPNGYDQNTVVYAVYFKMMNAMSAPNSAYNAVFINDQKTGAQTLPDSSIKEDKFQDASAEVRRVTVNYDENKAKYRLNFDSEFTMDKVLAHWLYSGNGHTIMTNTQSNVDSTDKKARYTHVDLSPKFDPNVEFPTELKLTFEGYFFQPYMVIDSQGNKMTIKETNNWKMDSLVSNTNPKVTFTVLNPNKDNNITVRTILRTNAGLGGKRIANVPASSVQDERMKLIADPSNDIFIPKDKAKALSESGNVVDIKGVVSGYVVMPKVLFFDLSTVIKDVKTKKDINIAFAIPPVNPTSTPKVTKAIPKTGDTTNFALIAGLMIVSALGFVLLNTKKRTNK